MKPLKTEAYCAKQTWKKETKFILITLSSDKKYTKFQAEKWLSPNTYRIVKVETREIKS